MVELCFVNRNAVERVVTIKTRKCDVPYIMRWYGAFYAGDDYEVRLNGEPVKKDRDGELKEPAS